MIDKLRLYANFLIDKCLSMNPGEPLVISYLSEQKKFVQIVKAEANKLGIKEIYEIENDFNKTKDILMSSSLEQIKKEKYFDRSIIKKVYDNKGSYLSLLSFAKNDYLEISPEKISLMNKIKVETQKDAVSARSSYKFPFCAAAVATKTWADEIFKNDNDSLNKLWSVILKCNLMDTSDPIKAQEEKIKKNTIIRDKLNSLKIKKLKYNNSLGTNICIGLPDNVNWLGTLKTTYDGNKKILINAPSDEIFTAPHKDMVDGVVITSMPCMVAGKLIERIEFEFKNGKIVNLKASNDEEFLKNLITKTDNLDRLGECSLVSKNSVIAKTNILFKNVLMDENRSCHIALGNAYPNSIKGGSKMSDDMLMKNGLNRAKSHIDLMIGTDDMNIVAIDINDNEIPIFINGDFNNNIFNNKKGNV